MTVKKKGVLSFDGSLIVLLLLVVIVVELIYFLPEKEEAKPQGYEVAALANMRIVSKAQEEFKRESSSYGNLSALGKANLIDDLLAKASEIENARSGYVFDVKGSKDAWSCTAVPAVPGITGAKSFYTDQTGAFRCQVFEKEGETPAGPASPTLEEWCCGLATKK